MKKYVSNMVKMTAAVALGALMMTGCSKSQPTDDVEKVHMEFDGLMGTRYTEFIPVWGNPIMGEFMGGVYNTVGLNHPSADSKDSSPQVLLDKVDMDKVKEDVNALSTVLNGPRMWTIDHLGVNTGKKRKFGNLEARWVMWFPIPDAIREGKDLSYYIMPALRDTDMTIWKGSRVYMLEDPEGNRFTMKSCGLIKDPNQKFEDLKDLGSRLKLPKGWKFITKVLEKELVFKTKDGQSFIVQDDIGNTYDRVGGPYSNYRP